MTVKWHISVESDPQKLLSAPKTVLIKKKKRDKLFFQKCVVDVQSHTLEHDGFMSNESSLQRHPLLHFNVRTFDGDNGSGPISYLGKARMAWGYNLD